jgi:hypothetical protein
VGIKRSVIWCDCGEHALSIEREKWFDDDKKIEAVIYTNLQFWNAGYLIDPHNSFKNRVRCAWAALNGKLYRDGIIINNEKDVQKIVKLLQEEPTNYEIDNEVIK